MGRRLLLEARIGMSPTYWLVPTAFVVLALMHTALGGGPALWSVNYVENCEAFIPIAIALASAPLLLAEAEEGTWELNGMLPVSGIAGVRLLALVGAAWAGTLLWLGLLRMVWGPVPFWQGVLAAFGPGLFLGGLATLTGAATGRASFGYLMAIGVPVADLVLKLLGAFGRLWPLQLLDVFAYRWPTAVPAWWVVKVVMAVVGLVFYAVAIRRWREYGTREM